MGAGPSVEIPGGGTEGYHVLRVKKLELSADCYVLGWPCGVSQQKPLIALFSLFLPHTPGFWIIFCIQLLEIYYKIIFVISSLNLTVT